MSAAAFALPLGAAALAYAAGLSRLWRRVGFRRGVPPWRAAAFAGGWLILAAALSPPFEALSRHAFWAHMVGHELLVAAAAPLLALSRPLAVLAWALPPPWRRPTTVGFRLSGAAAAGRRLAAPATATVLHGGTLWLWHAPRLFEAALVSPFVHGLEHGTFLATALLFWGALFENARRRRGTGSGVAALCLFVTSLHTGLLGALLVVSPRLWYPAQSAGQGLSALEDQQLAGLVMWVPGGLVYAGAALALLGLWIAGAGRSGGKEVDHALVAH